MKKATKKTDTFRPEKLNIGRFNKTSRTITIYVGNLSYKKDTEGVRRMFQKFGEVSFVRLQLDSVSRRSKGFGFVQMLSKKDAMKAIEYYNEKEVDGRTLKVSVAKEDPKANKKREARINRRAKEKELGAKEEVVKKPKKRARGLDLLFKK